MKDKLIELQKSLHQFLQVVPEGDSHEVEVLTADQFLSYATEQLDIAKSESEPDAKARLHHLFKSVTAFIEKNAFDGSGTALPLYRGDISRQVMTAYAEFKGDHTEKSGKAIPFAQANTEENPGSNAFGRGGPQMGGGSFTFRGKVGKAAAEEMAKEIASDDEFKAMLLAALKGDELAKSDDSDKVDEVAKDEQGEKPEPFVWAKDLNADKVDQEITF